MDYEISNIVAEMSSYNNQPAVKITFSLANPGISGQKNIDVVDFKFSLQEMSYSGTPDTWSDNNISRLDTNKIVSAKDGISNTVYWAVKKDSPNTYNKKAYFKILLKEQVSGVYVNDGTPSYVHTTEKSGDETVDASIKTTNPTLYGLINIPKYVNSTSFRVDIDPDTGKSWDAQFYQYRVNGSDWSFSGWNQIEDNTILINLNVASSGTTPDGSYVVDVRVRDEFYNYIDGESESNPRFSTILQTTYPFECFVKMYGQDGNDRYAGIDINADGSFTPNRKVSVMIFGNSNLHLQCRIFSNDEQVQIPTITSSVVGDELSISVDENTLVYDTGFFDYKITDGEDKDRVLSSLSCVLNGADYNESALRTLYIEFKDEAGNVTQKNSEIVLNNRIFTCEKRNLQKQDSSYSHVVMKENSYGVYDIINESVSDDDSRFVRKWDDIYFPATHAPKMSDGEVDLGWARRARTGDVTTDEKNSYDPVAMVQVDGVWQVSYDSEGRVTTTWNKEKLYGSLVSSNSSNMNYWVIDNTGYGDITLEFEHFDMDISPTGPPYNNVAPYRGDCVVVYNADDERCLQEVKNADGTVSYPSDKVNTAYMEILAVYTGSGRQIVDYFTGESVQAKNDNGAFDASFPFVNRVCIIAYTDFQKQKSGFKIKGGPKNGLLFRNWDVDETNGELWLHEEPSGLSTDKNVRMIYNYYDSDVRYDFDRGRVILNINNIGTNAIVTADYSYFKKEEDKDAQDLTRLFLSTDDDYYDYLKPSIYVTPKGMSIDKSGVPWTPGDNFSGKFVDSYWKLDPDRGVIEIASGGSLGEYAYVPKDMRITIDYIHHTFYRLSNDGYGTVLFENKTIVADSTPVYPDATWADIMIVNEGDAILEAGRLKFTARGETENEQSDKVTKVLDVNRPWDVQEGKKVVTYGRTRVYLSQYYDENYFQFSPSVTNLRNTYNSSTDNESGAEIYVDKSTEPYLSPKKHIFGRIVWNLFGGGSYPTDGLTVGRKVWSAEISGKYYTVEE